MKIIHKLILLVTLVTVISVVIYLLNTPNNSQTVNQNTNQNIGDIVEFTGILTDFDTRCEVDISCIAYVDGKEVITNPGDIGYVPKLGTSRIWSNNIGATVKVRAIRTGVNKFTLVGNDSLYVKVISN